jgi:hypothetical protein
MSTESTHPTHPATPPTPPTPEPHRDALTPLATTATISDLRIEWTAGGLRETRRGKIKPVVTGIPNSAFFHAYKHRPQFKATVRALGITLHRIAKNQWEAIAWINRHTLPAFAGLEGISIPDAPTISPENAPF